MPVFREGKIVGEHFLGVHVTDNQNLYFTSRFLSDHPNIIVLKVNFKSGEISLKLVFPIFSLDDVPEEITHAD